MAVLVSVGASTSERSMRKAGMWPTPQARDEKSGQASRAGDPARHGGYNLSDWVAMWPTPRQEDGESTGMSAKRLAARDPDNLPTAVKMWPTPTRCDATRAPGDDFATTNITLNHAVKMWPTPAARDFRAPNNPDGASRLSRPPTSGEQLPNAVGGVLNPAWVERLMGFPLGWTEVDTPATSSRGKATRRAPSAEDSFTAALA
jgi:hypothetical protein